MAYVTRTMEMNCTPGASPAVWDNVTRDVIRDPIRWSRGIFRSGPNDLVARPGIMSFTLDNSTHNSAGLAGYYTPGHANCRSGFNYRTLVRLKLSDGTNTRYVFNGQIRLIAPEAGIDGPRGTPCVAGDWLWKLAEFDALELSLMENVRPDEMLQAIVDLMPVPPANIDFDVAIDEYEFAYDDLGGSVPKGIGLAQDICQSERGYLYLRGDETDGETLRFENRHARALADVVATFTGADLKADDEGITVPSSQERVFNDIQTVVVPRKSDAAATTILVKLDSPILVTPSDPVEFFTDFRDPDNDGEFVGGKDMVQPQATTDYTGNSAEDGSGSNLTSDLAITADYLGSRVKLTMATSGTQSVYVRGPGSEDGMQCRGRGLTRYAAITSRGQNQTSIDEIGSRPLVEPLLMPYQTSRAIGQGVADFLAYLYGSTGNIPTRQRVCTEKSDALLAQGILRDIGDRIETSETQTAVDQVEVFINGVEGEVDLDGALKAWWTLAPADTSDVLIFDEGRFDQHVFSYA